VREPRLSDPISRRALLKAGLAGAAGLTVLPALIAACQSGRDVTTPTDRAAPTGPLSPSGSPRRRLSGQLRLGQGRANLFSGDPGASRTADIVAVDAAFEGLTGLRPSLNTIDPTRYYDMTRSYLDSGPDDLFTWFPGYRMRYHIEQGLILPIDDVWELVADRFTPGLAGTVTGDDGHVYGIPMDHCPWAMFYRKSVWAKHGYEVPATWDQLLELCRRMKGDGLTPIAFGDDEGWPAFGTFDMLNLRLNGYQFHMDLLRGKASWTDVRVAAVFTEWAKLVPYYPSGLLTLSWQGAMDALASGQAGLCYAALYMTGHLASVDGSVLDDIDLFEFPYFGNEFDAERTVEAPVDLWAVAARSPTLAADMDNARAYLDFWAEGSTQLLMYQAQPSFVPAASDVDLSKLDRLSAKSAQLVGRAQRITNVFNRDSRPDWTGLTGGVAGYFLRFLMDPGQDLAGLQQRIQDFWDALPPYGEFVH
jgi:multiple sugar transport system substrate-binding protein